MSEELLLEEASGTISIPAATLARLVVSAAELVDGARVRRPRRAVEISLAEGGAAVSLQLAVRYGAVLPELTRAVQESVGRTLHEMCGLEVRGVDVSVEELVER
ncbi:MAG TPA: Asp23/Gls24 family envelope stress response protein [Gaiellaceae bacterium]